MVLQPIVDVQEYRIHADDALVRGLDGASAGTILDQVNDDNRYSFDQACRIKAVELAARAAVDELIRINFLPRAVYEPEACIQAPIRAAIAYGFDSRRLVFEVSETEKVDNVLHIRRIFET
ncbi:MAG: hypothetical protein KDK39_16955 [Leptospiraceae bacterium]|nr:hypothetical protein [Leptospiraceae bacterium]